MAERLIPVAVSGPDLVTWLRDTDVSTTSAGPMFAQVAVDAPEGRDPRHDGLLALMIVLAQFEYKPRWRFVLTHGTLAGYEYAPAEWLIHVHTWVEDACHPGHWMEGHSFAYVPAGTGMDERGWLGFLRGYVIPRIEQHEQDEWFRYRGERIFDPHKPAQARGQVAAAGGNGRGGNGSTGGGGAGGVGGVPGGSGSAGRAAPGGVGGGGGSGSWSSAGGGCYP